MPVSTVSFVPPAINTGAPDIEKVHRMVEKAIEKSESKDDGAAPAPKKKKDGFSAAAHDSTVGGSIGNISEGYAANAANDLSSAC